MGVLWQLGIVAADNNKASLIFEELFPNFLDVAYAKPSEYVRKYWEAYEIYQTQKGHVNNNINGKVYEYILATLLVREGVYPIYIGAKVAFVPNVDYDILLYTKENGPICISAKTSLRERYKQADLESIALKYVHRKSRCYLVTNSESEAKIVKEKLKRGEVIGLDDVIYALGNDFDDMIYELTKFEYSEPQPIQVITSNQVVTEGKVLSVIRSI